MAAPTRGLTPRPLCLGEVKGLVKGLEREGITKPGPLNSRGTLGAQGICVARTAGTPWSELPRLGLLRGCLG